MITSTLHTTKNELRALIWLALPIFITQLSTSAFGLIDTIMTGQRSATDQAVVALGVSLWWPVLIFLCSTLQSATPLISALYGEKTTDYKNKIQHYTTQGLLLGLILGILGSGLLLLCAWILPVMPLDPKLTRATQLFLYGCACGIPAATLAIPLRSFSESLNNPQAITVISLICLVLFIPLNHILIYGRDSGRWHIPALGGAGCGFATAIIEWICLLLIVLYLNLSRHFAHFRVLKQLTRRHFYPDRVALKKLLNLGLPIGLSTLFEVALFTSAALVLSALGEVTLAAHQIALSVTSQLFMLPLSIAIATSIRMGQHFGQRDLLAIRRLRRTAMLLGTGLALISMLCTGLLNHRIVSLYSDDMTVRTLASHLLLFAVSYQLFDAWQTITAGCLRGIQDTFTTMLITLIAYWLIAFPIGYSLVKFADLGAPGFWFGLSIGLGCAAFFLQLRWRWISRKLFFT